jgi:hypothetical protein
VRVVLEERQSQLTFAEEWVYFRGKCKPGNSRAEKRVEGFIEREIIYKENYE